MLVKTDGMNSNLRKASDQIRIKLIEIVIVHNERMQNLANKDKSTIISRPNGHVQGQSPRRNQ